MQELILGRNKGIFVVKKSDMENFVFLLFWSTFVEKSYALSHSIYFVLIHAVCKSATDNLLDLDINKYNLSHQLKSDWLNGTEGRYSISQLKEVSLCVNSILCLIYSYVNRLLFQLYWIYLLLQGSKSSILYLMLSVRKKKQRIFMLPQNDINLTEWTCTFTI